MIAVNQLKTEIRFEDDRAVAMDTELLQKRAAKLLGVEAAQIRETVLLKHSIDARKKPQLFHVYTLGICLRDKRQEEKIVKRCRNANITMYVQKPYVGTAHGLIRNQMFSLARAAQERFRTES